MTATARREHQRTQLRREILEAASAAFADEGYESLSMRKLAARLDCAPGTLYLYFRNKEELVRAVVEESFAELLRTLQSILPESDPLECLRAKMHAYVDFGLCNPNQYKCAFVLPSVKRDKERYKPYPAFTDLVTSVRACAKEGCIDEEHVELASQVLWSCIHGLTSLLIARPKFPWIERKKLIDELIEAAIAGIARHGGCVQTRVSSRKRPRKETAK